MSKIITVIYGSSTGNTEHAAQLIAGKLGGRAVNIRNASAADFQADLLILGTSTWGCGELQDDWMNGVALLNSADLSGRKVALFGLGDAVGFGDTYLNAMGELAEKSRDARGGDRRSLAERRLYAFAVHGGRGRLFFRTCAG
ncbi:MAG: flavodoxin domain-containing protein [Lentisphaeria bacterium]|nr:MAG: flavodoxin domain-containing protein [Lentisphaeria bacterium]